MPNYKTELGYVLIDNEVVARIAGLAAMDCYGIVGMAARNVKDGFVQLLKKENLAKGIKIYAQNNLISLDLHIIVEFGTNIVAITETLIQTVQYRLHEHIDCEIERINVLVEGIRVDN